MTPRKPRMTYLLQLEAEHKRQQPVIEATRVLKQIWDAQLCPDQAIRVVLEAIKNLDEPRG